MEAPTPTAPKPAEMAAVAMTALMVAVLSASRTTSSALTRTLSSAKARVPDWMRFLASAPAPLRATPTSPPESATEAAAATTLILAVSSAVRVMLPAVLVTPWSAFLI